MKQHFWKVGLSGTVLAAALLGVGLSTAPKATQKAVATLNSTLFGEKAYADTATGGSSGTGAAFNGMIGTVNWSYASGVLTLSGGSISSATSVPWSNQLTNIKKINITGNITLSGTGAYALFSSMPNLTTINGLTKVNTAKVTSFIDMFNGDSSLTSLDLTNFDTRNTTDDQPSYWVKQANNWWGDGGNGQQSMFSGTTALSQIYAHANTLFEDADVTHAGNAVVYSSTATQAPASFNGAAFHGKYGSCNWYLTADGSLYLSGGTITSVQNQPWRASVNNINKIIITGKITLSGNAPYALFANMQNVTAIEGLTNVDTTNANSFIDMFNGDSSITSLDLSSFDLSNTMDNQSSQWVKQANNWWGDGGNGQQSMFSGMTSLNTLFATSKVTDYLETNDTTKLNQNVKIKAPINHTALSVKNVTVIKGSKWSNTLPFVSATNSAGNAVGLGAVKVTGTVNTAKAGNYTLTYSYGGKTAKSVVTVVDHTALALKNITIGLGTNYTFSQSFNSAKNVSGNVLKYNQVKWSGSVDTKKAGVYTVKAVNADITKTATVTVKNMTALDVKNVTYSQFGTWNNSLAFTSAKNASGAAVALSQVKVTGSVNTAKTGQYTLTYSYGGITKKAVISIVAPSIIYDTQVQGIGWQKDQNDRSTWFSDGQEAGTNGQSKRMESIKIALKLPNGMTGSVVYDAHVQNIGWQNAATPTRATSTPQTISPVSQWFSNGATAGTVGKALRMEAFTINLTGEIAKHYNVIYDSHVQNIGWQYAPNLYYQAPNFENPAPFDRWFKNGQEVGTNDHGLRMEALEIKLVAK
ncbi:MAG: bacterial Ig-like domain-containing protein [Lactococcus hircilactis]